MVKTRHSEPNKPRLTTFSTFHSSRWRSSHSPKTPVNGYETDVSDEGAPVTSRNRSNSIDNDSGGYECSPQSILNSNNSANRKRRKASYHAFTHHQSRQQRHVSLPRKVRRSTRNCPKVAYDACSDEDEEEDDDVEGTSPKQRQKKHRSDGDDAVPDAEVDMYTRVKRDRPKIKRDMYGVSIHDEDDMNTGDSSEGVTGVSEDQDDDEPQAKSYYLREHKPRVNLYEAPSIEPKSRPNSMFKMPKGKNNHNKHPIYRSPARKSTSFRKRKRTAFHGSSSTSSSSEEALGPSDEERKFDRRKAKSMAKDRQRFLPMNFDPADVASGVIRDREKSGASLADVEPMSIDRSVTFEQVGGMGKHIRALKEMIVFPLLYPEVFDRFKITPPRGVLFYGPPGTGKTLVARALANECGGNGRRVGFYMRKGADCLSKWVGESERQLRVLFDQAYLTRPSIIFFDEIDGLAPVRSSRQDQIHSSIVSTLLALMDGLDNRGEVVVIGATNKIDAIDPALRRPGRFDREFLFPMPSVEARVQILQIHTRHWEPKVSCHFLAELANKCVGYCGADMKALCTEAALHALRRRYPQIYNSEDKLQLDVASINISPKDFYRAMQDIVPTAQRSTAAPGRALAPTIKPLLHNSLERVLETLHRNFPRALARMSNIDSKGATKSGQKNEKCVADEETFSDDEDDESGPTIFEKDHKNRSSPGTSQQTGGFLHFMSGAHQHPSTHRPRLLLSGDPGQGQSTHIGPAILHHLENLPAHVLDLPALFASTTNTPEESCAQIFHEARRTCPSIIYLPHLDQWWDVISDMLRATFLTLLHDLNPTSPILFLATCDVQSRCLPQQIRSLFDVNCGEVVVMRNPSDAERHAYFEDLFMHQAIQAPAVKKPAGRRLLEVLPKAKPPDPRKLTDTELKRLRETEEETLRELRLFLRDVVNKMARDRKFTMFTKPVDAGDVTDYYKIIKSPMDLSTMMTKIDNLRYQTVWEFLEDIELVCKNALEYNPDKTPEDRAIRHRACALKDTAHAIVTAELDPEFEKLCHEIVQSRHRRGELTTENVPAHFKAQLGAGAKDKVQMVVQRRIYCGAARSKKKQNASPWCRPSRKRRYKKVVVYINPPGDDTGKPDAESTPKGNKTDDDNNVDSSDDETDDGETPGDSHLSPSGGGKLTPYSASSASPVKERHSSPRSSRGRSVSPMKHIYNGASESDAATSQRSGRSSESPEKKLLVVYDPNRLNHLVSKTVDRTQGYTVEKIERLYNLLCRCIYERRRDYNKAALIQEMEQTVERFTRK